MASFNLSRFESHLSLLRDFPASRVPTLIDRAIRRTQIESMGLDQARAYLTGGLQMDHHDFCLMKTLMQRSRVETTESRIARGHDAKGNEGLKCAV